MRRRKFMSAFAFVAFAGCSGADKTAPETTETTKTGGISVPNESGHKPISGDGLELQLNETSEKADDSAGRDA